MSEPRPVTLLIAALGGTPGWNAQRTMAAVRSWSHARSTESGSRVKYPLEA